LLDALCSFCNGIFVFASWFQTVLIEKTSDEPLGVKIVSGSDEDCYPFSFPNTPGVYVVYVANDGPAARAGLKIGHRIIAINEKLVDPLDKNKIAMSLLEAGNTIELRVRKHAPPHGFMVRKILGDT
jgi:S1-C subfamily serine protease